MLKVMTSLEQLKEIMGTGKIEHSQDRKTSVLTKNMGGEKELDVRYTVNGDDHDFVSVVYKEEYKRAELAIYPELVVASYEDNVSIERFAIGTRVGNPLLTKEVAMKFPYEKEVLVSSVSLEKGMDATGKFSNGYRTYNAKEGKTKEVQLSNDNYTRVYEQELNDSFAPGVLGQVLQTLDQTMTNEEKMKFFEMAREVDLNFQGFLSKIRSQGYTKVMK